MGPADTPASARNGSQGNPYGIEGGLLIAVRNGRREVLQSGYGKR